MCTKLEIDLIEFYFFYNKYLELGIKAITFFIGYNQNNNCFNKHLLTQF